MAAPTILIALDSADLLLLRQYADAGQIPCIASLLRNTRIVEGPHHFSEMGAWTTFWSGVPIVEHGYHCIRRLVPNTYGVELVSAPAKTCAPFWASKPPGSVSIWDAQEVYPDRSLEGEQLCNWRTSFADRCPPTPDSWPTGLLGEVVSKYGPPSRPEAIDLEDTPESRERNFNLSQERIRTGGKLFRDVLSRGEHDFYVLGTAELHSAAHLCWTYDADGERRLVEHHRALDRELEAVFDLAPPGSRILIASSYGIFSNYPVADATELILRGLGYLKSKPQLRNLIPLTVRKKIGEFMPQSAQEAMINNHIAGTDWSKSVAYGMPTLYTGYVRINVKGREPEGIVDAGAEYRQLVQEIASEFAKLESPRVKQIRCIAELNNGEPPLTLPDIVVTWEESAKPWDEVIHSRFRAPIDRHKFHRNTYHSYSGFLATNDDAMFEGIPDRIDIPEVAGHLTRISSRQ